MATLVRFDDFSEQVARGIHDWDANTFKVALSNVAPNAATMALLADITEIAAGNGYTAGGFTLANIVVSETGGVMDLSADDLQVLASGGTMATWRYAVVYNDTPAGKNLVGYLDAGAAISLIDGASRTLQFSSGFLRYS